MQNQVLCCIGIALLTVCAGCASSSTRNTKIADSILISEREPDLEAISALAEGFRPSDFTQTSLGLYPEASLGRIFKALDRMSFFFPENSVYTDLQRKVFDEKVRRGTHSDSEVRRMFLAYLSARMFDEAASLKRLFPDIKLYSMPEKVLSGNSLATDTWRVYSVLDAGQTIMPKALPLGDGPRIVMLMLPGCEVAEKAMREILANPGVGQAFREHGVVITNRINAESVALWKSHFGFPEVYISYKASDFPGFDFNISPIFYFLKDGEIVWSASGWDKNSHQAMQSGLIKISAAPVLKAEEPPGKELGKHVP